VNPKQVDGREEAFDQVLPSRMHRFEEVVLGQGTNGQKLDSNGNYSLGACRDLDACRAFRHAAYKNLGLEQPQPARTKGPFRVIMIENKRFGGLHELLADLKKLGSMKDFDIRVISWSKTQQRSKQSGNITEHLDIISHTDVHMSGPGTGMMYQTFLPEGAVHINLGAGGGSAFAGYMEEYMAEGAPYLRALYYRPPHRSKQGRFDVGTVEKLLLEAKRLLQSGAHRPTAIGSNLSPVGRVFKAYCYFAHRHEISVKELARDLTPHRDLRDETWLGNHFAEDIVFQGMPGASTQFGRPDTCMMAALRASFDRRFPDLGEDGKGWFGTQGKLK